MIEVLASRQVHNLIEAEVVTIEVTGEQAPRPDSKSIPSPVELSNCASSGRAKIENWKVIGRVESSSLPTSPFSAERIEVGCLLSIPGPLVRSGGKRDYRRCVYLSHSG